MIIGIDAKALAKRHTGIAVYLREVLSWMQRLNTDNHFILFSNIDFEIPKEWHQCKKIIYKSFLPGSFSVCFRLHPFIEKLNIDIFWGPEHCVPLQKSHYKKAVTIHDLSVIRHPEWGTVYNAFFQRCFAKNCIHSSDAVIAISKSTKNDTIELCKCSEDKIHVIYNGDSPYKESERRFSIEQSKIIRKKFHLNRRYFFYCGTLEPRKNIDTIVKAFNYLKLHKNIDRKLVLCGGFGWKYHKVLKQIKASAYSRDIILTDYVTEEEKEFLYRNADCLLFPSHYEGFGFPVIEGLSCGIPVITARNSSLTEAGGNAAIYIDYENDYEKLAELMMHVISLTPVQRKIYAEKGKQMAGRFSRKTCASDTLNLFEKILYSRN